MSMDKVDFKKKLKKLYVPSAKKPIIIDVPEMNYIMIDGKGNPNTSVEFQNAITALYNISYNIKMLPKKGIIPEGYFDYVVPPLEGIWDTVDGVEFDYTNKDILKWTLVIMQPEFVTRNLFNKIQYKLFKEKDNPSIDKVRFESLKEGLCAQIMHIGSYDDEPATFKILEEFIQNEGYSRTEKGHHEIYLSDFRRTKPEKLKTVIRCKVKLNKS